MRVTNDIPLGSPLFLPVGTVNCVQTLKATATQTATLTLTLTLTMNCVQTLKAKRLPATRGRHHHSMVAPPHRGGHGHQGSQLLPLAAAPPHMEIRGRQTTAASTPPAPPHMENLGHQIS
jgi:hypothetical protein